MARKTYIGDYDMPKDIEATAHAFYEAVKNSGFDSGDISICPALNSETVFLFKWTDEGIESVKTEFRDGRWRQFVFGGDGGE